MSTQGAKPNQQGTSKRARLDSTLMSGNAFSTLLESLQLEIISFLPAGELYLVSPLNRAFHKLARTSLQERLRQPLKITPPQKPEIKVYNQDETPLPIHYSLKNPWCNRQTYRWECSSTWDDNQVDEVLKVKLEAKEYSLRLPEEILAKPWCSLELQHCSIVHDLILLIITKKYGNPTDWDDDIDDEEARQELWTATYKVSDQTTATIVTEAHITHRLQGPMPPSLYFCTSDNVCVGKAWRSSGGSGTVFAVVTCLHCMDEFPDIPDEYTAKFQEGDAKLTIFEVHDDARTIVKKHVLHLDDWIPDGYCDFRVSLNHAGTVVSVVNLWQYEDGGVWKIYNIAGNETEVLMREPYFPSQSHETFFTPDNEFVISINDQLKVGLKRLVEEQGFLAFADRIVVRHYSR